MAEDVDYPTSCQAISHTANNNELVKRLRILADALHDCPPNAEIGEPKRFQKLFKHLSSATFLNNTHPDVQIYLAICLSSILRLFVPEIPVTEALQLKDVFFFLFRVIGGLGSRKTEGPMFKRYHYLLEVMTLILHPLSEMRDADEKTTNPVYRSMMKAVLQVPSGGEWTKLRHREKKREGESAEEDSEEGEEGERVNVSAKIIDLLLTIAIATIQDMDYVPNTVLDVLFHYLTEPQHSQSPDSYAMAKEIILRTKMQIEPSIHNVLQTAVMAGELPADFEMAGSGNRAKFLDVFQRLHHIAVDLVGPALPFLSRWLQAETVDDRVMMVRLIGRMTHDRHCLFGDDVTWRTFLTSSRDESEHVREEFARQTEHVLTSTHTQLRGQITQCLLNLSKDKDENVRATATKAITYVAQVKLEAISEDLLKACCERMKDKKSKVHITATKSLMYLYYHVMTSTSRDNEGYTESERESVAFIPQQVLNIHRVSHLTAGLEDSRSTIERFFQLYFVPYKQNPVKRVEIMANLFRKLDDVGTQVFGEIVARSSQLRRALTGICSDIAKNDTVALTERIRRLASAFHESHILERVLKQFVNLMSEDEVTFEYVKYMISDDPETSKLESSSEALNKRVIEKKMISNPTSAQGVAFRRFIERCSPLCMDKESARALVAFVTKTMNDFEQTKKSAAEHFERDLLLLKIWTENFAHLFTSDDIIESIRKNILNRDHYLAVEVALDTLSSVLAKTSFRTKLSSDAVTSTKWYAALCEDVRNIILSPEPQFRRCCKLATKLTTLLINREQCRTIFGDLVNTITDRLQLQDSACANAFQALTVIYTSNPKQFHAVAMSIVNDEEKIGPGLMTSAETSDDNPKELNPNTYIDKQPWPRLTAAKVYAMKFATNVLVRYEIDRAKRPRNGQGKDDKRTKNEKNEDEEVERGARRLIPILVRVIEANGDVGQKDNECPVEHVRLRAAAGACLLKLFYFSNYRREMTTEQFITLSRLAIDDVICVRFYYIARVRKGISRRLPIEFAACFGLVRLGVALGDEETSDMSNLKTSSSRSAVQIFMERSTKEASRYNLSERARANFDAENVIPYVVYLLAHHPSLSSRHDTATLSEVQESLWYVFDALHTSRCNMVSVLKIMEQMKSYGDRLMRDKRRDKKITEAELTEQNEKMWAICDLGMTMLIYRAKVVETGDAPLQNPIPAQFFYEHKKSNPAEVYAPDELIEDEKQRNGKLPKGGRTAALNTSKKGRANNTTVNTTAAGRRRGGKIGAGTRTAKEQTTATTRGRGRRKVSSSENDEEVTIEDDSQDSTKESVASVNTSKQSIGKGKGKTRKSEDVYDIPLEEDEDEVVPVPKKRGKVTKTVDTDEDEEKQTKSKKAVNGVASPSKKKETKVTKTNTAPLTRRTSGRSSGKTVEEIDIDESDEDEPQTSKGKPSRASPRKSNPLDKSKMSESLEDLMLSPIAKEGRPARRAVNAPKLTSSTPFIGKPTSTTPLRLKRKQSTGDAEPSSKRRTSGRQTETSENGKEVNTSVRSSPRKSTAAKEETKTDRKKEIEKKEPDVRKSGRAGKPNPK